MSNFADFTKLIVFAINGFGILLAFWVYSHDPKSKLTKIFGLMTFFMIIWINGAGLARLIPQYHAISLLVLKLAWAISAPFFVSIYFFVLYFLKEEKKYKFLNFFSFISAILWFFILFFSDKVIKDISFLPNEIPILGLEFLFGDWIFPFLGYILLVVVLILYLIWKKYFILSSEDKIRTKYFLIGLSIFLIANVIFNIYYPVFLHTSRYYQIADYTLIFFLTFTAYAIVKHHLFGVRVILTELLVGLIAILLLLNIVVSRSPFEYAWKGIVFGAFLVLGYLLIQSVFKEIQQRKKIEKMTQDLRKANLSLKELTGVLDQKVKEKTEELEKRIDQLERFQRLTIGRELKMAGLKKEIRELKKELGEKR